MSNNKSRDRLSYDVPISPATGEPIAAHTFHSSTAAVVEVIHHENFCDSSETQSPGFCVSEAGDFDSNRCIDMNVSAVSARSTSEKKRLDIRSSGTGIIVNDEEDTNNTKQEENTDLNSSNRLQSFEMPIEIPPENETDINHEVEEDEDDESEYSYDYDDDDGHFTGFLLSSDTARAEANHAAVVPPEDSSVNDRNVVTGDQKEIVEEDVIHNPTSNKEESTFQFATFETSKSVVAELKSKPKWKEPTKQAVSMSLRAEKEKTGGRRRLAADLYKVMMTDTEESGFSVEQTDDECMNEWTVRLFKFDEDSDLHKDMVVLGLDHVELRMTFPDQYPFEPPFVQVVRPRFKRQTGFVMNGALCMELLTSDGWNPINSIESVIVSIRSLLVVGDGRLEAATKISRKVREERLAAATSAAGATGETNLKKRKRGDQDDNIVKNKEVGSKRKGNKNGSGIGSYSAAEAKSAYSHLSNYHEKKGWSEWWSTKG